MHVVNISCTLARHVWFVPQMWLLVIASCSQNLRNQGILMGLQMNVALAKSRTGACLL